VYVNITNDPADSKETVFQVLTSLEKNPEKFMDCQITWWLLGTVKHTNILLN